MRKYIAALALAGGLLIQPALGSSVPIEFRGIAPGMTLEQMRKVPRLEDTGVWVCLRDEGESRNNPELNMIQRAIHSKDINICLYMEWSNILRAYNSMPVQIHDTRGNIAVYLVRENDEAEYRIVTVTVTFDRSHFNGALNALKEKFGQPSEVKPQRSQNSVGAQFNWSAYTWSTPTAYLTANELSQDARQSTLQYVANDLQALFIRKSREIDRSRSRL